jgi:hypothetical protein
MDTTTRVTIKIGDREERYVLAHTTAPKAYDYPGALELYDGAPEGEDKRDRYILVREEQIEYQRGRNFSGLHTFTTEDLLIQNRDIEENLWRRIYGEAR